MAGAIFISVFLLLVAGIIIAGIVVMMRDTPARRAAERPALVEAQARREVDLEQAKARIREEQTRASGE